MSNTSLVASRLNLTDAEIATELNALTVRKTDSTRYTWAGLATRFNDAALISTIYAQLSAVPTMSWAVALLAGVGIDFSTDITQGALEQLRPAFGDGTTDALKAIGVWHVSPWKDAGNAVDVTVEEVAEIRAQIETDDAKAAVQRWWNNILNEKVNQIISEVTSEAEGKAAVKAAIAEVE